MTQEKAKEMLPFIQALAEGKTIQIYDECIGWADCKDPSFCMKSEYYRIKPEPAYRPFKDFNELMHITGTKSLWLVSKESKVDYLVTGHCTGTILLDTRWYTMQELFEQFTFGDGTPCGVEVKE